MERLPLNVAVALGLAVIAIALAIYLVWDRDPERVQRAVRQALRRLWTIVRRVSAPIVAIVSITALAPAYLFAAYAWVLLRTVCGEKSRITVKFS